jgi:hypothetical protein
MRRALVTFRRPSTEVDWTPTAVFLATPDRVDGRDVAGDPDLGAWLADILASALSTIRAESIGSEPATYEDWIGWALSASANGYFMWAVEVEPAGTIDELYERVVASLLAAEPEPVARVGETEAIAAAVALGV